MDNTVCCAGRGLCAKGCSRTDKQLNTFDYLADVPGAIQMTDLVEVQFKNTHKDYFLNSNHIPLNKGDVVAVEASPGHDIGTVSLTGPLVPLQMSKQRLKADAGTRRIYRIAREIDMEKFYEAKALEQSTMIRSRAIAKELGLDMKIGDVEYQGDGGKAIFYYIADQRVDFRQLIKVLAQEFGIRIEMKQIGARQEAGLIGGFGPCGREMCCATWMKNFSTVSTGAARCQDVSLNPQKLAGQCAKLKCCLNYETAIYTEAIQKLPRRDVNIETQDATYYYFKADILAGLISYSTDKHLAANIVTITSQRANEIIQMNQNGEKPETLHEDPTTTQKPQIVDLAEQDSLTRFDKSKRKKKKNKRNERKPQQEAEPAKHTNREEPRKKARNDEAKARNEETKNRNEETKARNEEAKPRKDDVKTRNEEAKPRREKDDQRPRREQPKAEGASDNQKQAERPNNRRRNFRNKRPNRNNNEQ